MSQTPAMHVPTAGILSRPDSRISERGFSDRVVELARWCGWTVAHFGAAQTSKGWRTPVRYDGKGFPDLVLVHPERGLVWFRELKVTGRPLDPDQRVWRDRLTAAVANYDVWRPSDWADIVAALSNGRAEVMS